MSPTKYIRINDIVTKIGQELHRSEKDIKRECEKLEKNWIVSLYDWITLSEDRKNSVGLPVFLNTKIEQEVKHYSKGVTTEEYCYIVSRSSKSITLLLNHTVYEFHIKDTVDYAIQVFGKDCFFQTHQKVQISKDTILSYVLVPGNRLCFVNTVYVIHSAYPLSAIDNWLFDIKMQQYANQFYSHDLDDFLTLPFLKLESLEAMGINLEDRTTIYNSITQIMEYTKPQFVGVWLKYLGFESAHTICEKNSIDLYNLLLIKDEDYLQTIGFDEETSVALWQVIEKYKKFSSVEETFQWLRANNFDKYSFHFARYNIPFYALPFVNFFIINEMGVTIDDQQLLSALQELKDSPTYNAKAVTFWLRDLEMETYNLCFAKNKFCCLENYTTLDDRNLDKYIDNQQDKDRMKTGIREMKEFQFYYTATSSLLQELGMEKYSQLFALHGISIDVLPLLTEPQLIEMGITKIADRKRILSVIQKIKDFIPPHEDAIVERPKIRSKQQQVSSSPKKNEIISTSLNDTRTVEEWLSFINDGSRPVVVSKKTDNNNKQQSKKSKRKKKKAAAKKAKGKVQQEKIKLEDIEKEITSQIEKNKPQKKKLQTPSSPQLKSSPGSPSSIKATSSSPSLSPVKNSIEEKAKQPKDLKTLLPPLSPESSSSTSQEPFSPSPPSELLDSPISQLELGTSALEDFFSLDDNNEEEMDPEIMAMLDAEVEEFRKRLESASTKSKLVPIFYLPD